MKEEENNNKSTGEIVTDNALKLQKAVLRQKIMIGALVGVIAVGGAGVAGYKLGWFGGGDDKAQEEQVSADIDPNAGDWDGTIPEAPKGDPNAEGNPCYFTFQLVLKDSGEVLYESKQVPPGEAITTATLSKALDAGEYAAELRITTASIVDLSPMNGANMETVLDVR